MAVVVDQREAARRALSDLAVLLEAAADAAEAGERALDRRRAGTFSSVATPIAASALSTLCRPGRLSEISSGGRSPPHADLEAALRPELDVGGAISASSRKP